MPTMASLDPRVVLELEPSQLPRHVAIIMDGNGRWAQQRGLPRIEGHRHGAKAVRDVVTHAARLGLECLTLYSFSLENWKRPRLEVDGLMALYAQYLADERREIMDNNIRLVQLGRRQGLPDSVLRELDLTIGASAANTGLTLCLALNYGARAEITDAVQAIARRVRAGELAPEQIDEALFSNTLGTAGLPDPDLLIRTADEMRLSNFLLWQISYAEIFVTSTLWPDFRAEHLNQAIRVFAKRERRFGDVTPAAPSSS
ncbi:MAG: Ditrans,polycis-undecaprenyl-diphosphate synthase ((2E,6E)-farnesyl-diphosphate specific) [Phycisphaerae bacterium]|nr:Ditrans,polycis-undecaprenyl-diphosphate synthase ((2E,6E)-farnesyl-diphosphate specific) [Phycisphaerae bacterium]